MIFCFLVWPKLKPLLLSRLPPPLAKFAEEYAPLLIPLVLSLSLWWLFSWQTKTITPLPITNDSYAHNLRTLAQFNHNPAQVFQVASGVFLGFHESFLAIIYGLVIWLVGTLLFKILLRKKPSKDRRFILIFLIIFYGVYAYFTYSKITIFGDHLIYTPSYNFIKTEQVLQFEDIQSLDLACHSNGGRSTTYACDMELTTTHGPVLLEDAWLFSSSKMTNTLLYLKMLIPLKCQSNFTAFQISYSDNISGTKCVRLEP